MQEAGKGTLVIVGTGIQLVNHITYEAKQCIEHAEKVLHVVADYPTQMYIENLNSNSESLNHLYKEGRPRWETYDQMVDAIMKEVRNGLKVCAVFYGHPGVFVNPSHKAIRIARSEGYEARMLPSVSAEDCLFADLGVDPGDNGCQSFEATDFLIHQRKFDPTSDLILWQIGGLGIMDAPKNVKPSRHIGVLVEVLKKHYGDEHEAVVYEASSLPNFITGPSIQRISIGKLTDAYITQLSTLYIPPKPSTVDQDMVTRLGLAQGG